MTRANLCASRTTLLGLSSLVSAALLLQACVGLYREVDDLAPSAERQLANAAGDASASQGAGGSDKPYVLAQPPDAGSAVEPVGPGTIPARAPLPQPDASAQEDAGTPAAADGGMDAAASEADGGGDAGAMEPEPAPAADSGVRTMPQAGSGGSASKVVEPSAPKAIALPPVDVGFDYQVGKVYPPSATVAIVARDHTQAAVDGRYNICEISGFRVREQDRELWLQEHPALVLRDDLDSPVIDRYSSMLLDVSTDAKRAELVKLVGQWIARCASAGFDAVAINDLDAYAESDGRVEARHILETMKAFSKIAHGHRLAIGQKNASELAAHKDTIGTDFAVAEECNRYRECDVYRASYGDHVLVLEYRRSDFENSCDDYPQLPTVLRDSALVSPNDPGYVYDGC